MSDLVQKDIETDGIVRPNLEFVLNDKAKDIERMYIDHWFKHPDKSGTFDKKDIILGQYPQFAFLDTLEEPARGQLIYDAVERLFAENWERLSVDKELAEQKWKSIEETFFQNTQAIFGDARWPEGEYQCYMSIVNINTLLKSQKSFQLFYEFAENGFSNAVIAHEMLHFIFYKYLEQFPEYDKQTQWEMAEIFNAIAQNSQRFKDFNYPEEKKLDPELEKKSAVLRKVLNPEVLTINDYLKTYKDKYL